jgi:hypothetical protein
MEMVYENAELGLKVAENDEEKYWLDVKETTEKDIANLEKMLKFNKAIVEMAQSKIKTSLTQQ